jgi:hypothetical protein
MSQANDSWNVCALCGKVLIRWKTKLVLESQGLDNDKFYNSYDPYLQGRREGGGGRGANCPEVLGAPENFLLGPSLFCVLNIYAQRTKYLVFWAKYRNLALKIEIKSLESNCNAKKFAPGPRQPLAALRIYEAVLDMCEKSELWIYAWWEITDRNGDWTRVMYYIKYLA